MGGFFRRALKIRHILAIAIGGTISTTYFLGNGYILKQVGPFAFLAFLFGGFITFLTMRCMAELASNEVPDHRSFVGYAEKYISPSFACGVGWSYWANWVIFIPGECLAGGILMNGVMPQVPVSIWAFLFALFITLVNIRSIKAFAEAAWWLTYVHISLFVGFTIMAILILFGWIGTSAGETHYFLGSGAFPNGIGVFFTTMVILILNFQGTEIVGLTASEAIKPKQEIPSSMREISWTITALYSIPILLLALIFPWQHGDLQGSVFAIALENYGFTTIGRIFTFLVVTGALACSNSGLYAAARSLHALSLMKMAPKNLQPLNRHGMPARAVLCTFFAIWAVLLLSIFFPTKITCLELFALSGFTGSIAWISICWSQLRFRQKNKRPGFAYLTHFAIWAQLLCLVTVLWNPELRQCFYFGVPVFLIPMLLYKFID